MTRDIRSLVRGDQSRPHLVVAFARRRGVAPFLTRSARPGGKCGHTALWDEAEGEFNEALMFKGVVGTPQDEWFPRYSWVDLIAVPCPHPERGLAYARAHKERRTPYDYEGALSVPWRADWQNEDRMYCSEKETLELMHAGLTLFADPQRGIHPHDFYRVAT